MSGRVLVNPKGPSDKILIKFPFLDKLEAGETITGQSVVCEVFSGVDVNASSMITAAATVVGTTVEQEVDSGLVGVIYTVVCTVTASSGHVYTKEARLAVITPGGKFGS